MRRFSQRNSFVTLSEINITPLLDLAFVLLIIFVITRPLLEQNMNLQLPAVGKQRAKPPDRKNIRTVEINSRGEMLLGGRPMTLSELENSLATQHDSNPDLVVVIRGDKRSLWNSFVQVLDACQRHGITQISYKTAPVE
jgi:biopolymer transport protein ExbD